MRSKGWLIAITLFMVGIVLIWWRASVVVRKQAVALQPKLQVASVTINDIDGNRINMSANMILSNPLPVNLKVKRLDYQLLINGNKVLESSYNKPLTVTSTDSTAIKMPMEILTQPLVKVLHEFDQKKIDSADYTLQATLYMDVPVAGERSFEFNETKKLPAFRLPKLKPEDIDINKFNFKESSFSMEFLVENPNQFPFVMKDVKYDVTVGKDLHMDGKIAGVTNIPAESTVKVPVQLAMQTKNIGRLTWKALFDKDDTQFEVDFTCKLVSKNKIFENSLIAMKTTGTLEELKESIETIKEASNKN